MKKIYTLVLAVLLTATAWAQNIITVDNTEGNNAQYNNLQDAIDNATAGDTLYVHYSPDSYGSVTVNKPLHIIGRSSADISYVTTIGNIDLRIGSSGTTLEGMNISSISGGNDLTESNDLSITDISIVNNKISSVNFRIGQLDGDPQTPSPFMNNILIRGNVMSSILTFDRVFNVIVSNNILVNVTTSEPNSTLITHNIFKVNGTAISNNSSSQIVNVSNNVFITGSPSITVVNISNNYQLNNNLTFNYASGVPLTFATNNSTVNNESDSLLNTDPQFTAVDINDITSIANGSGFTFNPFSDNLIPAAGSPLLGNGFNGVDIGIYNGGFDFKPFGNAAGVPDVKIDGYSSSTPANSTIEVSIKAKTN